MGAVVVLVIVLMQLVMVLVVGPIDKKVAERELYPARTQVHAAPALMHANGSLN
jgi:hypothetical protein